jgi:hypothetical protein
MDLGGEFGGAMLGRLKEIVWELSFDAREVCLKKRKVEVGVCGRLWRWLCQEIELRPMHLKAIDLLMMKGMRADDELRAIALPTRRAQARVGRERPVVGEPGADSAFRDMTMEALANELLGFSE